MTELSRHYKSTDYLDKYKISFECLASGDQCKKVICVNVQYQCAVQNITQNSMSLCARSDQMHRRKQNDLSSLEIKLYCSQSEHTDTACDDIKK